MSKEIEYSLHIGWQGKNAGGFRIGTSTIAPAINSAGYDQLSYEYTPAYGSFAYDDLTGMTFEFVVSRGRDNRANSMLAGKMDTTIYDPNQLLNPKNTSSAIYQYLRPLRPARLRGRLKAGPGPWEDLFHGFLRSGNADYDIGAKTAKFHFEDFFLIMSRFKDPGPVASSGPTNTGNALKVLLQLCSWENPALLDIDAGDSIPGFDWDGSKGALEIASDLVTAEGGIFYVSRQGKITYKDKQARGLLTSDFTFPSARGGLPAWDLDLIKNVASVTKEGGEPQIAQNSASISEFGRNAWPAETSPYFDSDAAALSKAQWKITQSAEPTVPVQNFEVEEGTAGYASAMLMLDIQRRITVTHPDFPANYHIEQIVHRGGGGTNHKTAYILSGVFPYTAFIVGTSTIAADVDSVGAHRIAA